MDVSAGGIVAAGITPIKPSGFTNNFRWLRLVMFITRNRPTGSSYQIVNSKITIIPADYTAGRMGGRHADPPTMCPKITDFIFSVVAKRWGLSAR
ncbi:MAG: hypothetical protein ACLUI3_03705 [Christensenellales bacterium]